MVAGPAVKQFDSIANMQADPNPSDGDLALVYGLGYNTVNIGDTMSQIYFLDTVNFNEPVNTNISSQIPRRIAIFSY